MGGFAFKLGHQDGTPADPPTFKAAVPDWRPGHTIHLAAGRALRVVAIRDDDADQPPTLIVEDLSEQGTRDEAAWLRSSSSAEARNSCRRTDMHRVWPAPASRRALVASVRRPCRGSGLLPRMRRAGVRRRRVARDRTARTSGVPP
jgi:hypothetical protein